MIRISRHGYPEHPQEIQAVKAWALSKRLAALSSIITGQMKMASCQSVNLIVSTGHNNWAMSNAVDSVAKTYISGHEIREGMLNRVEAAIRAYDPCLSCSTHAVGQMPIELEVLDVEGNLVQTLSRTRSKIETGGGAGFCHLLQVISLVWAWPFS